MNVREWLDIVEETSRELGEKQVKYNRHGSKAGKIRKKGSTNCVGFVMEAMYNAGLLRRGASFWLGKKIHGKSRAYLIFSRKFHIRRPARIPAEAELKPGDICGFQFGSSIFNRVHTMIYAGQKGGELLWYSFSPVEEKNGWITGPLPQPDFDDRTVYIVIRIRELWR